MSEFHDLLVIDNGNPYEDDDPSVWPFCGFGKEQIRSLAVGNGRFTIARIVDPFTLMDEKELAAYNKEVEKEKARILKEKLERKAFNKKQKEDKELIKKKKIEEAKALLEKQGFSITAKEN